MLEGRVEIPPLAGEDFVCDGCALSYANIPVADALAAIATVPDRLAAAVRPASEATLRQRPASDVWSVIEYSCHLRDVYASGTIRLYRMRGEDGPVLEPMLNDLRAVRFRYNERALAAVLDDTAANAAGFGDEAERFSADDWDRTASRLPGETRTARWMVRQVMHEGEHHLRDVQRVLATLPASSG